MCAVLSLYSYFVSSHQVSQVERIIYFLLLIKPMQLHSSISGPVLCPFGRVVLFYYEDRLPIRSAHITGRAKNTRLSIFTCDGPLPLERCVFNVAADNENSFSPPVSSDIPSGESTPFHRWFRHGAKNFSKASTRPFSR